MNKSLYFHLVFVLSGLVLATNVHADVYTIALDISSSTPIVQPNFMQNALPKVREDIAKLPIGSRVKIFTVGDDNANAFTQDLRIQRSQTPSGDTAPMVAKNVEAAITAFLNDLRANPSKMQGESSLSAAFLDASKWCVKGSPCTIQFWTDGMEYQPGILAWPKDYQKPLPPIPLLNLDGTSVIMYGVGVGVPTFVRTKAEEQWQKWLKAHQAGNVDLRRL